MRKLLFILIIILPVCGCNDGGYVEKVREAESEMAEAVLFSEAIITGYKTVWRNAIYKEGGYYNSESKVYLKDYNEALAIVRGELSVQIDSLTKRADRIDSKVKALKDPPSKYERVHEQVVSLYGDVMQYVSMAISPQGSLNTFSNKSEDLSASINTKMREIEVQLPERNATK